MTSTAPAQRLGARPLVTAALVATVCLAALNLRPAIVAIGPLADRIQSDAGLGAGATSLLTTLPLLCLGVFAAGAAPLARLIGFERTIEVALGLVLLGSVVRLATPVTATFVGSVLAGCGIAVGNVVVPALIKERFARRLGSMMALFSVVLQLGATLAAGLTVPLVAGLGLGWRWGLAAWGVPALLAMVAWLPWVLRGAPETSGSEERHRVWTSSLAWAGALFIGLQSAVFYSLTAWLPALLQDAGLAAGRAGLMLSVVAVLGILGGLPMPLVATRMGNGQRPLVIGVAVAFAVGLLGLVLAPASFAVVWAVLLGLAQGAGLSLALTLFTLRGRSSAAAAQLAGMGQTAGYVVAAAGPLLVGVLHQTTGGWTVPVLLLLALLVPFTAAGLAVARPRLLEDETSVVR